MADILWHSYHEIHIASAPPSGHGISEKEFSSAWHSNDRSDIEQPDLATGGRQFRSRAMASSGRRLVLIWRWDDEDLLALGVELVFPITAFPDNSP